MAGRLDGKVCVITGAGGGMGREAAIVFSEEGAKVCAADVDEALAEETASLCSGEVLAFRANVADEAEVAGMYRVDRRAFRWDRRPLQQRRHLAGRRRVRARHSQSKRGSACRT